MKYHSVSKRKLSALCARLLKVPTIQYFCTFQTESSCTSNPKQIGNIGAGELPNRKIIRSLYIEQPSISLPKKAPAVNHSSGISFNLRTPNNIGHMFKAVTDSKCQPTCRLEKLRTLTLNSRLLMKERDHPRRENCRYRTYRLHPGWRTLFTPGQVKKPEDKQDSKWGNKQLLRSKREFDRYFIWQHTSLIHPVSPLSLPVATSFVHEMHEQPLPHLPTASSYFGG